MKRQLATIITVLSMLLSTVRALAEGIVFSDELLLDEAVNLKSNDLVNLSYDSIPSISDFNELDIMSSTVNTGIELVYDSEKSTMTSKVVKMYYRGISNITAGKLAVSFPTNFVTAVNVSFNSTFSLQKNDTMLSDGSFIFVFSENSANGISLEENYMGDIIFTIPENSPAFTITETESEVVEIIDDEIIDYGSYNDTTDLCSITIPSMSVYGTCGDNLEWELSYDGTLTISGSGAMTNWYSSSAVPWYSNRSNIKTVIIESGVTSIGDWAFSDCKSLSNVQLSEGVVSIGMDAFYNCDSLSEIIFPDGITTIGEEAFCSCGNLTNIILPDNLSFIGDYAFQGCDNLLSFITGESNINYSSYDGVLFNKSMTELVAYPGGKKDEIYSIPNGVKGIGRCAFSACNNLKNIIIPDSVTSIEYAAFDFCNNIISMSISNSVTSIGDCAFYWCSSLSDISLPEGLTSIGASAFNSCTSLSSISIPEGVTSIGASAFSSCDSLSSINIPASVTSIGGSAFSSCDSLSSISLPDSLTSIGAYAFNGCDSLTDVYYDGTENEWTSISIGSGNEDLTGANIHYAALPSPTTPLELSRIVQSKKHPKFLIDYCAVCRLQSL